MDPIVLVADAQGVIRDQEGFACNEAGQRLDDAGNAEVVHEKCLGIPSNHFTNAC